MTLKLFRSTGYSTILLPGEARLAPHPGWALLAVSAWVGLACNVALWRALLDLSWLSAAQALVIGVLVAAATTIGLGALCWRRTFKPAASLLLLLAGVAATGAWTQVPEGSGLEPPWSAEAWVFPAWPTLVGWRAPLMLLVLGLAPMLALWNTQLRRLTGPAQMRANLKALVIGFGALASAFALLKTF